MTFNQVVRGSNPRCFICIEAEERDPSGLFLSLWLDLIRGEDMGLNILFVKDKSFYRKLFAVAFPIILQNMITIGVNMMDTIMLGKYGEIQLSGSSLASDFINVFQILCLGVGSGAAVLTAQYWGSRDLVRLKKVVALMLRLAFGFALIFTFATFFFAPQIMRIYTNDIEVIEKGVLYFRWSIITYILMSLTYTLTQVLRSVRLVRIPLYASIVGFVTNIFFNWVFIFGHLGAPEMQIAGAALGTVIARFFETSIIAIYFFVRDKKIGFRIRHIFMKAGDEWRKYLKYSIPVILSDSLLGFGNSAVSIVIGHMGTRFVAAYAIIGVLQRLSTIFSAGLGQAAHTITGNRIGEGKTEQAFREAITMLSIAFLIGVLAAVLLRIFGPYVIGMYEIQPETREIAIQMLNALCIMITFQAFQSVITKGILRGGGDILFALGIDAVFMWLISIPAGFYIGLVLHGSAFATVLALKIDWAVKSVIGLIRVLSKKWIHSLVVYYERKSMREIQ